MKIYGKALSWLGGRGFTSKYDDTKYLKRVYKSKTNKNINLEYPKTYNEKLQWLKLNYRPDNQHLYVDKYEVRKYVNQEIGEEYLVDLLAVYDTVDEIEWSVLPEKFVLKCTHGSGSNIICKDKANLDIKKTKKKLKRWMRKSWYWYGREWPYRNIKPRLIVESYIDELDKDSINDYKFFVFNGKVKSMFIATDRFSNPEFNYYDRDFNILPFNQKYPNSKQPNDKPKNYNQMVELAEKLGKSFPHVRIDFYNIDGKIIFGEMTFYHFSGFSNFEPEYYDELFGKWIDLPK